MREYSHHKFSGYEGVQVALPKKGSRRIVIGGHRFLWHVRRRPTYGQALCQAPLVLAVEAAGSSGSVLLVELPQLHPSNWMNYPASPVLPSQVENCVRQAIRAGWQPTAPGKPFLLSKVAP